MLSVSFFHGADINLLTFVGILFLTTSLLTCNYSNKSLRLLSLLFPFFGFIFYLYFLSLVFEEEFIVVEQGYKRFFSFALYLVPIFCLAIISRKTMYNDSELKGPE